MYIFEFFKNNPFIGFNCFYFYARAIITKFVIFKSFKLTFRFAVAICTFFAIITNKLLTSFDNEVVINLKLSINFSFYVTALPLSSSFLIGNKKVIYFSVFSPKHSNLSSNSFDHSLIIKW